MTTTGDIFDQREEWRLPLGASLALHTLLFGSMFIYAAARGSYHGESWGAMGAGGGAISATLVSSVPLPPRASQTENVLANESTGISQSLPKQAEQTAEKAIPIPERERKIKKERLTASNVRPQPEEPSNIVPFGQGGAANTVRFSIAGGSGGLSMTTGAAGDFGSRYGWYVDVVRRKISENWFKYEVDPNAQGRRVWVTFEIERTGRPRSVQVEQSSGVPTLDISAVRAIQRIDTFGPLPPDYRGEKVSVEFWFEYNR